MAKSFLTQVKITVGVKQDYDQKYIHDSKEKQDFPKKDKRCPT